MAESINGATDILGGSVIKYTLNTTTPGQAVITKLIAGTGITMTSTGIEDGTGEVTLSIGSTPGGGGGTGGGGTPTDIGTVTSVNMLVPVGLRVIGGPITTAGTLSIVLQSGYEIPTTNNINKAISAYSWGNHALAGYAYDSQVVHNTGTETVAGLKTFTSAVKAPNFILSGGTGNTGMYYGHTNRLVLANYTAGGIDFESNGGTVNGTLFPSGNWGFSPSAVDDTINRVQVGGYVIATGYRTPSGTSLGFLKADGSIDTNTYIKLTDLSSTITGITYTNTTGVFSLTSGYVVPTTTEETNWNTAYTNRITSLTVTGSNGSATLISNTLNIPTYTLAGLGGQTALSGTGFVKISGTTISYDNSTYYLASNPSAYISGITSALVISALGFTPYNATNPNGYISSITSGMITTALGYTPVTNARTLTINGVSYDLSADRSWTIAAGVSSFNTRTGAITLTSLDVTTALGFTPENVANKSTSTSLGTSNTLYPTQAAVKSYVDNAIVGGITIQGTWDASTNTPNILGTTNVGFSWQVSVAGNTSVGGIIGWEVGELVTKTVTGWAKIGGEGHNEVYDFNGRYGSVTLLSSDVTTALGFTPYNSSNPSNYISASTAASTYVSLTGTYSNPTWITTLAYSKLTGVPAFLTTETDPIYVASSWYATTNNSTNWNTAYTNRITTLTTTGSSGASTLSANTLNIPNYTLSGLGGQTQLNGTGFVKASGTTISYDNTSYLALTGGTLTGALGGTSASFSGGVQLTSSGSSISTTYAGVTTMYQFVDGSGGVLKVDGDNQIRIVTNSVDRFHISSAGAVFSVNISASNFSGTSSGTNTGDQTNISGNSGTTTLAANSTLWNGYAYGGGYSSGTIGYTMVYNSTNARWEAATAAHIQSWLGLGSMAYVSTSSYVPTSGYSFGTAFTLGTMYVGTGAQATVTSLLGVYSNGYTYTFGASAVQTWLGLGSMAYASTGTYYLASNPSGYITSSASISGSAATATYITSPNPYNSGITDATTAATISEPNSRTSVSMHNSHGYFGGYATTLTMSGYDRYGAYQISGNYNASVPDLAMRNFNQTINGFNSWTRILSSANYNSYAPTLTGSGASGTWGISITGNAATVGGYAPSGPIGANTVVIRDVNNYIYAYYINSSVSETENPTINSFYTSNGDGWLRKSSLAHVRSQLGNYGGWITGYTETDTLASVTARGSSTTGGITVNGDMNATGIVYSRANQTTSYTTAALWTQSFGSTLTGIAFHISGVVGRMLYMNTTDANLYWNGTALVYNSGTWSINVTGTAGSISGYNNPTTAATANTIVYRDGNGDVTTRELVLNVAVQSFTPSSMVAIYPTTNQAVKVDATGVKAFLGLSGNYATRQDGTRYTTDWNSILASGFYNGEATPSNSPVSYGQLIMAMGSDTGLQIAGGYSNNVLQFRGYGYGSNGGFHPWRNLLHDNNYNSYAPTLTGGGASGTWSINVTGSAGSTGLLTHNSGRVDGTRYNIGWFAGASSPAYSCDAIQIRSSDGTIFSTHYRGSGNVDGTGEASHHPAGIYSQGTNWLYGSINLNSNVINDASNITMISNTGIQYSTTHWIRPKDSSGNLHIKADSGGIYLDADTIHLRGLSGANDTIVNGGHITTAGGYYTNAGMSTNGRNTLLGVQSPGGASRANSSSTETGSFKITLPSALPVYGMFKLVIHIYEYGNRGNGYEIHCGGHMYPNYMHNRFQVQYGTSGSALNVRYGNDGTHGCIWIGDTSTTWLYPQIWVSEFMMGYSNKDWVTWRSGWDIDLVTSYGNSGAMDGPYACDFGYSSVAGSLSSMNISQFTNNSGYITGYSETDTLSSVTSRGASTNSNITVGNISFQGVGGNSGQSAPGSDYRIYQAPGEWSYPYPDLNIAWHTGISIGAYSSYGGTRFYNNSDMATELFSVGNGDNHIRVANRLLIGGTSEVLGLIGMGSSWYYGMGISSAYTSLYSHVSGNGVRLGYYDGTTFTPKFTVPNGGDMVGVGGLQLGGNLYIGGQTTYFLYNSASGIRSNNNLLADADIYLGTRGTWLSSWLNQGLLTTSDPTFNSVYLANGNLRLYQGDGTGLRIVTAYGYVNIGPQNGSYAHIYSSLPFYFNQILYVNGTQVVTNSGSWSIDISGTATYGRYVYNNGAYSGSGWIEPSDLGVRYANSAGSLSSMNISQFTNNSGYITTSSSINSYAVQSHRYHSNRDFGSGTLIVTSIDYAATYGDPFILEITGNTYGSIIPWDIQYQGYIYADTIINHGGISNGTNITGLVAINYGGNLCFWFPRQTYWQGFNVFVYTAYGTYAINKVTSISDVAKPTTAKEVSLVPYQSLHSANYNSYTPTLTGAGASGTWGISISGNAASASHAVYLSGADAYTNGSDGWWRSNGNCGWYNASYAVGIYATEGGMVRTYNGAAFTAAGGGFDSDLTLKDVITRDLSTHKIANDISVIVYTWKDKNMTQVPRFGYGAQELLDLIPEAVYITGDKYAVDYTQVHTVLIDENTKRIQALEKRIAELENTLLS